MAAKKIHERNYLFGFIGALLSVMGGFAVKPEGVRSAPDAIALFLGVALCAVQIAIWIVAIARWIRMR